jgi:hypothetical protein
LGQDQRSFIAEDAPHLDDLDGAVVPQRDATIRVRRRTATLVTLLYFPPGSNRAEYRCPEVPLAGVAVH